ncbi:MAG: LysR family transcriptional regulator [Spirulinaceae cyanobacterium RM2_2_10]|nr:LysR family transcriptional regulator [Spirulinaceae cyanobacterium SM2_1_0]NJO21194.1 LysR family transcriptional regulator [Spirulinaceae cyanobacterium RM2_2_10]
MAAIALQRVKLSQLRILVAVAAQRNFSAAALQLEISQSAVSHAIAQLESELGINLLTRGRQGAVLTPVGEQVLSRAQQILQLLDEIGEVANREKGLQGGTVRVASFRSVSTHLLPLAIAAFRQDYPNVEVAIAEHDNFMGIEQALRRGHADLGFTYLPTSPEFLAWEILRDQYVALLPPGPDPIANPVSWEILAQYPLIVSRHANTWYPGIEEYIRNAPMRLKIGYEVSADSTVVGMVGQGLGAAIMPCLAIAPLPTEVRVCQLPIPFERAIGASVLAEGLQAPAVYAFLETLQRVERPTMPF